MTNTFALGKHLNIWFAQLGCLGTCHCIYMYIASSVGRASALHAVSCGLELRLTVWKVQLDKVDCIYDCMQ